MSGSVGFHPIIVVVLLFLSTLSSVVVTGIPTTPNKIIHDDSMVVTPKSSRIGRDTMTFRLKDDNSTAFIGDIGMQIRLECGGLHEISEFTKTNWYKNGQAISMDTFPNVIPHRYYIEIFQSTINNTGLYACQIFEKDAMLISRNGYLNVTDRTVDSSDEYSEEDYYDEGPELNQDAADKLVSCENYDEAKMKRNKTPYLCFDYKSISTNHMAHYIFRLAGSEINIHCHARGYPEPKIIWFRDGSPYRPSSYREAIKKKSTLKISESNPMDSGIYTCRAFHPNLTSMQPIVYETKLEVKENYPKPIVTTDLQNQTLTTGSRLEIRCEFESSDFHTELRFYRNSNWPIKTIDETYEVESRTNDSELFTDPNLLVLDNVTEADEGWYTCIAGNAIGRTFSSAYVAIVQEVEPPEIDLSSNSSRSDDIRKHKNHPIHRGEAYLIPAVGFPLLVTLIFILLVVGCCCHRMNKTRMKQLEAKKLEQGWTKQVIIERRPVYEEDGAIVIPEVNIKNVESSNKSGQEYELPLDKDWEFPRDKLILGKKLGEGAFGEVVLGEAQDIFEPGKISNVAVKTLKKTHCDADMIDLISEMEIMKEMGKNVNVISLLGCCTQGGELLVIMEFCEHGNLKDYLRKHRARIMYERPSIIDGSEYSTLQQQGLNFKDLMSFAFQVARGMEYLVQKKYVHRDLAARNVLVCKDKVVKIADFGMARSTFTHDYYRKKGAGPVPVKWMAPETLHDRVYTSQSDVWSYGILLFEIVTFGGTPYPAMDHNEILTFLASGQRMDKPANCPHELYLIMRDCWLYNPESRPTFAELAEDMKRMLRIASEAEYLDLDDDQFPEYIKTPETSPENSASGIHFDPEFLKSLGILVDPI